MPDQSSPPPSPTPDWQAIAAAPAPMLPPATLPEGRWPQSPARHGEVYRGDDPSHPGRPMCFMTESTFLEQGTIIEALRRTCLSQDKRIKELTADNAVLAQRAAESETRLNNLRQVRRSEKRAELEKEIVLPGDPRFNSKGK